ncbi:MAG: protein-L-isoaspartate(D-aspartate) O-methyltransferase [Kiloniellales bacterium]|nr:protein-L-isoaspartate(D-aspartate) O-methyltransferase [Kiloniellales bacterium]
MTGKPRDDRETESREGEAREAMVGEIVAEVAATAAFLGKDRLDPRVLEALRKVPRHAFVPAWERPFAYENRPLPIGEGQTISQPYIVAIMTDLARIGPGDRVLEVGTGCGYQAAVLAELAAEVDSIERVPALAAAAAERLADLGYRNVRVRAGDGTRGWPEADDDGAPRRYDAILVTAAAQGGVPAALTRQLAPGGRLVIPVERHPRSNALQEFDLRALWFGPQQDLLVVTKDAEGKVAEHTILPVAFVPLIPEGKSAKA